jgi:hypothetical protein
MDSKFQLDELKKSRRPSVRVHNCVRPTRRSDTTQLRLGFLSPKQAYCCYLALQVCFRDDSLPGLWRLEGVAHHVNGLSAGFLPGGYDGQQLDEEVCGVVIAGACGTQPVTRQNASKALMYEQTVCSWVYSATLSYFHELYRVRQEIILNGALRILLKEEALVHLNVLQ